MSMNENIEYLLNDTRNCRSRNMIKFFKFRNNRPYCEVIRWNQDGCLWFVTLGWLTPTGENGFAGVKVATVASYGKGATSRKGYPSTQKGNDYEIVTDWFWDKYKERGMVAIPEIWHIKEEPEQKHCELHTI